MVHLLGQRRDAKALPLENRCVPTRTLWFQNQRFEPALVSMRVWIQHFKVSKDPNPDPGFWKPKVAGKKLIFFWSKIEIYLSLQVFSPQQRTSRTWHFFPFFYFVIFVGNFCRPGSGSGSSRSNQCGSGSATLFKTHESFIRNHSWVKSRIWRILLLKCADPGSIKKG